MYSMITIVNNTVFVWWKVAKKLDHKIFIIRKKPFKSYVCIHNNFQINWQIFLMEQKNIGCVLLQTWDCLAHTMGLILLFCLLSLSYFTTLEVVENWFNANNSWIYKSMFCVMWNTFYYYTVDLPVWHNFVYSFQHCLLTICMVLLILIWISCNTLLASSLII